MLRISQTTAKTISPIIKGMAQAGSLAKTEANAAISILHDASKNNTLAPEVKPKDNLLTTAQAAMRLGVCTKTILRMREDGKLKGVKLTGSNRSLRFPESEIERFLNSEV